MGLFAAVVSAFQPTRLFTVFRFRFGRRRASALRADIDRKELLG